MNVSYLDFVKETLCENYGNPFPSSIKEEDYQIGVQLFTKLAVFSTQKLESSHQTENPSLSEKKVSLESESLEETTEKVRAFVKEYSYDFWLACCTGFPFSMLDPIISEKVLEKALGNYDSIIVHLLNQDGSVWLTEEELEVKYGEAFKRLNIREVGDACSDLKRAYTRDSDKRAGYYLLWLIKHSAGCDFEIPSKDIFDESTIKNVLTKFISCNSSTLKHPVNFLELFFSSSGLDSAMYQDFLEHDYHSRFLNFTVNQLQSTPMDAWPKKGSLITGLLETVTTESKIVIAKILTSSLDPQTAKVGQHILNALASSTLRAAIPHFNALTELLPNFNDTHVEIIFGRPFETFRYDKSIYKTDPDFTRRLKFNDMRKVFVSGDLMIGVYNTRTTFGGKGVPPHLLAYNMKTEKMEWGISLTPMPTEDMSLNPSQTQMTFGIPRMGPARYKLNRVGEDITLQFIGQQNVHFINSNTGEIKDSIELPYEKQDEFDHLHITPNGFGYQMTNLKGSRMLIGGAIANSKLNPVFEVKTPSALFLPLSTHVGFFKDFENKLVLFGPTGKSVTIDCLSSKAYGDKLFLIEPNPSVENTCKLTIRTMTNDDNIISDPEKTIELKTGEASINSLCDNGQLVLFHESHSKESPIFVSLTSGEIVYGDHKAPSYAEQVVNTATGELWSWDQLSKKIWKISSKGTLLMGLLESGRGTTLLHVDESDHLYFVDIPF